MEVQMFDYVNYIFWILKSLDFYSAIEIGCYHFENLLPSERLTLDQTLINRIFLFGDLKFLYSQLKKFSKILNSLIDNLQQLRLAAIYQCCMKIDSPRAWHKTHRVLFFDTNSWTRLSNSGNKSRIVGFQTWQLKWEVCKKLLLYKCNSDQLSTFFFILSSLLSGFAVAVLAKWKKVGN